MVEPAAPVDYMILLNDVTILVMCMLGTPAPKSLKTFMYGVPPLYRTCTTSWNIAGYLAIL